MEEYYATLNLPTTATADEVKKSYRHLAKIYHPDRNPNDPDAFDKFNTLTIAYDAILLGKFPNSDVIAVTVNASLTQVYYGFISTYEEKAYRFEKGFTHGTVDVFAYDKTRKLSVTIILEEYPGFTRQGLDITTTMTVSTNDIKQGKVFLVPNHPNPFARSVKFHKETKDGDVVIHQGGGLPGRDGSVGDLYVRTKVVQSKPSFPWFPLFVFAIILIYAYVAGGL